MLEEEYEVYKVIFKQMQLETRKNAIYCNAVRGKVKPKRKKVQEARGKKKIRKTERIVKVTEKYRKNGEKADVDTVIIKR